MGCVGCVDCRFGEKKREKMALRLPPVLPVVPEEHAVATGTALTRAGAVDGGLVRHRNDRAPWQSPAVRELAQAVGKSSEATPMIVEGRTGSPLLALASSGTTTWQRAVSSSLNRGLHEKLQRAEHENGSCSTELRPVRGHRLRPTVWPRLMAANAMDQAASLGRTP